MAPCLPLKGIIVFFSTIIIQIKGEKNKYIYLKKTIVYFGHFIPCYADNSLQSNF
jgi:hypothetical protein